MTKAPSSASFSILRATFSQLGQQPGQTFLSVAQALSLALLLSLCQTLLLGALAYLPYSLAPKRFFQALIHYGPDSSILGLTALGWFSGMFLFSAGVFTWLAALSATLARKICAPEQPRLQRLPLPALMGHSLFSAVIAGLFAMLPAVTPTDGPVLRLMLAGALMLIVQPLLASRLLLKVPGRVIAGESLWSLGSGAKRPGTRRLWALTCGWYVLLVLMLVAQASTVHAASSAGSPAPLVFGVNLLLWLSLPLLPAIAGVKVWQNAQIPSPAAEANSIRLGAPLSLSLPLLAGAGLLLFGISYWGLQQKLVAYEQDWQIRLKQGQAQAVWRRPVLHGQALPGNGAGDYRKLFTSGGEPGLVKITQADMNLVNKVLSNSLDASQKSRPELPELLGHYPTELKQLRSALQHEVIDYAPDFKLTSSALNYIEAQNFTKIIGLSAGAMARRHACREAAQLFLDSLRLGQDIGSYPTLISQMVGVVLQGISLDTFGPEFKPDCLSPAEYHDFLGQMANIYKHRPTYFKSFAFESYQGMDTALAAARKGDSAFGEETRAPSGPFAAAGAAALQFALLPQYLEAYQLSAKILELELQGDKTEFIAAYKSYAALKPEIEKTLSNQLMAVLVPNLEGALERMGLGEAKLAGIYQYAALLAYHREKGSYPASLQALVPTWLPELPQDPFTGKPFVYRQLGPHNFVLYSVGSDGHDQGGKGVYYRRGCLNSQDLAFTPQEPLDKCQTR